MHQLTRFGAGWSCAAVAALSCLAAPQAASAALIGIAADVSNSTEGLGDFEGTMAYSPALTGGILTVVLTNTSDVLNGGYITGFVFNVSGASEASATLSTATHPFLDAAGQSAPPFGGPFTAGAALDGDWTGGGNPAAGIAVGQTGTFIFDVTADDGLSLKSLDFADGPLAFNIAVRFRGFDDGSSDKAPGVVTYHIPAPGALALLALAGLRPRSRRRA